MSADLDLARLRGRRLFIGTPMYSGQCHSAYALGIAQLSALCAQIGVAFRFAFVCNEALVPKARNATADAFLRSGDDHLIFIDADIGFDARDVIRLLALQTREGSEYDVIAAPYPLKELAWENVREAARRGLGDADAGALARYAGRVNLAPAHGPDVAMDRPIEATQAGTGFMMIRRDVFERYRAAYPHHRYRPDRASPDDALPDEIHAFFETEIDGKQAHLLDEARAYLAAFPKASGADLVEFLEGDGTARDYTGAFVSEDYAFCRRVRAAGMKVWVCPWIELTHTGSLTHVSRIVDLAEIGAI